MLSVDAWNFGYLPHKIPQACAHNWWKSCSPSIEGAKRSGGASLHPTWLNRPSSTAWAIGSSERDVLELFAGTGALKSGES
jgi:hypothetical protein